MYKLLLMNYLRARIHLMKPGPCLKKFNECAKFRRAADRRISSNGEDIDQTEYQKQVRVPGEFASGFYYGPDVLHCSDIQGV